MGLSKRTEEQAMKHYDREEKREALMSYFRCRAGERRAEDKVLEFMLARSAVSGIAYDKIGGGGSDPKLLEDYLAEQGELEAAVDRARSDTRSAKEAVIKWIQNTGEEKEGILRMRFIVGMDVGIIAMINTWSRRHTERKIVEAIDALPAIPGELLDMSYQKR